MGSMPDEEPKPGRWAVLERPPPPRDELLRMLRADEPVSMAEIFDAVRDKRLTDEEAREFLPQVYRNPEVLAAKAFGIDLGALAETQNAWSRRMELLADNFRQPYLASESLPLVDPQLAATREVR